MVKAIYLDHNATTPMRPAALEAMAEATAVVGNPSSVHGFGRGARHLLDESRERVAGLAGVAAREVVFTSGGTEANTLAILGSGRSRILVSAVEHASVLAVAEKAERIAVDNDGVVDCDALADLLAASEEPALVSVMLANNETGVIQPVAKVAEIARKFGALVHCDAVQAAGKVALDMKGLDVDLMSVSAHKLGGPPGIGALMVAADVSIRPLLPGGGQERGRRGGTENLPGIAGFAAAAGLATADLGGFAELARLRDRLEERILAIASEARIFGRARQRLPNTTCFAVAGLAAETQVMALDLAGVAVSAGAACASGRVHGSHVLAAMGVRERESSSAIRVSFGWSSEDSDEERFVAAWRQHYERTRDRQAAA